MGRQMTSWRDKILAMGWGPQSFLVMARILDWNVDQLDKPVSSPVKDSLPVDVTRIDWEAAYNASPQLLKEIGRCFDPAFPQDQPPTENKSLGHWLRETMDSTERIMTKAKSRTDLKSGMIPDETVEKNRELKAVVETAKSHLQDLLIEIKVNIDNTRVILTHQKTMTDLLEQARAGDDMALLAALQINRWLTYISWINSRIQKAVAEKEHGFLERLARATEHRQSIQKNAKIWYILTVLWEAGLKKLTYRQIRGFLKEAGLMGVPSTQALERSAERLGLKKYVIE